MSKDYVFTAWELPEPNDATASYWIWGEEICPDTGRLHYQGFIILDRRSRFAAAKRAIGGGIDVHLESRQGTRAEARAYCIKDGVNIVEHGTFESLTQKELFKKNIGFLKEEYPAFFCRYYKGLYMLADKGPKWRDVQVTVLWGDTDTGKTRQVMEMDDVFKLDPPYTWWDGYEGETILLLDDYKDGAIARGALLNICDGYRLRLPLKGGHTWARWDKVYITSNFNPVLWACHALTRRVTSVQRVEAVGNTGTTAEKIMV